jgi:hypothetical protein
MKDARRDKETQATVAGISGGTLLIGLSTLFPANSWERIALAAIAPGATIALRLVWLVAVTAAINYVQRQKVRRLVKHVRRMIEASLASPDIRPAHRLALVKQVEQLNLMLINRDIMAIQGTQELGLEEVQKLEAMLRPEPT